MLESSFVFFLFVMEHLYFTDDAVSVLQVQTLA